MLSKKVFPNLLAFYSFLAKALVCFNKFLSGKSAWFTHLPKMKKTWKKKYELKTLGSFSQFAIPKNYEAIPPTKLKTKTWHFTKKNETHKRNTKSNNTGIFKLQIWHNKLHRYPSNWSSCFFFSENGDLLQFTRKGRSVDGELHCHGWLLQGIPPRKLTCPSFGGPFLKRKIHLPTIIFFREYVSFEEGYIIFFSYLKFLYI